MKINEIKIIVVGATGLVGREMLKILSEIHVPVENITAVASSRSKGKCVNYRQKDKIIVQDLSEIDFCNYDVALFSAGSAVSKIHVPIAVDAGCYAIDNTSYFRMCPDVPLVVPEINIGAVQNSKLIANPNCSTIQTVLPLKPLHDLYGLLDVIVSTYQAAGGAGQGGIDELKSQINSYNSSSEIVINKFPKQLAFNVIPLIGTKCADGHSVEEQKMINEIPKILSISDLRVAATCVRVPVLIGHAVSVTAVLAKDCNYSEAINVLSNYPGIKFIDDLVTPLDIAGKNDVYVCRFRHALGKRNVVSFWCVADNIRKGAALNAVQILQQLCKNT